MDSKSVRPIRQNSKVVPCLVEYILLFFSALSLTLTKNLKPVLYCKIFWQKGNQEIVGRKKSAVSEPNMGTQPHKVYVISVHKSIWPVDEKTYSSKICNLPTSYFLSVQWKMLPDIFPWIGSNNPCIHLSIHSVNWFLCCVPQHCNLKDECGMM